MNFDNKKIMPRFFVVIVLMSLGGLYILGNAAYLMFVESEYWTQVSRKLVKENVPIPAKRGNILSADGNIRFIWIMSRRIRIRKRPRNCRLGETVC